MRDDDALFQWDSDFTPLEVARLVLLKLHRGRPERAAINATLAYQFEPRPERMCEDCVEELATAILVLSDIARDGGDNVDGLIAAYAQGAIQALNCLVEWQQRWKGAQLTDLQMFDRAKTMLLPETHE